VPHGILQAATLDALRAFLTRALSNV